MEPSTPAQHTSALPSLLSLTFQLNYSLGTPDAQISLAAAGSASKEAEMTSGASSTPSLGARAPTASRPANAYQASGVVDLQSSEASPARRSSRKPLQILTVKGLG